MNGSAADRTRSHRSRLVVLPTVLVAVLALACGDSTEPRRAVALGIATQPPSNAQSGVALTQVPVVELRDKDGARFAQAGVTLTASIADGGGTLGGTTTRMTDADGGATFSDLVISGTVGPRTLRFSAPGLTAATSTSIAVAPGLAATVEPVSVATLQATVNTAVAILPSVVVKDASGNGVPDVAVTFAVASSAGALTGAMQSTNASGIATVGGWTLPTTSGQYTLTASAAGVAGNGVAFTATATPDAPNAMHPSGGGQSALYGSRLATPLQVRVVDQYGNPTPNVIVTWGSVTGLGTVEPINVAADVNGLVRSNYRLGTTPGENVVRASITSRSLTADFSVNALAFSNQVSVAIHHTCALDETGVAYCWGQNEQGQVGDGSTINRDVPTAVGGSLRFQRISAGVSVTCALTTDDVPYCWGSNRFGSVGDGTTADRLVPTPVIGGHRFTEVTTSGWLSCGLTAAGAAYCWGSNEQGQLGIGTTPVETCDTGGAPGSTIPCSHMPLQVAGSLSFASIAVGGLHACGLTSAAELYCWGMSTSWGDAWTSTPDRIPVRAASGFSFSEVTAGQGYTCGIVAPSSAYCWGGAGYGALGNGVTDDFQSTPVLLTNVTARHMDASILGTCAVATDGRAFCWGYNQTGGVGDGTTTDRSTPTAVVSGLAFTAISTSAYHGCGRTASGQVHCWGNNIQGQLGIGGGPNRVTPTLARP
jgi:alpha-tubulin suppressor-like RCC1 family protein